MSQREIRFSLGLLDLYTLLFFRKQCPRCGRNLVRQAEQESTGPRMQVEAVGLGFRAWYGNRTDVSLCYVCEPCGLKYTLEQIRRREPGAPLSSDSSGAGA